ncbi:MAG: peptidoglycan recognition family protein [Candidatus Berkelbacteria bacterium]|nr:peptidoglycan recognition family protein [Candidatus Berkelbacteria bacterium]
MDTKKIRIFIVLLLIIAPFGVLALVPIAMIPLFRGEQGLGPGGGLSGGGCLGSVSGESGTLTKDGHSLPAASGKVGREQHLNLKKPTDSPTDNVSGKTKSDDPAAKVHYQLSNTPAQDQNGMAGGYGARGKPSTVEEERYYINMRWDYSGSGGSGFWFEPPQTILVTNPANNKQVRAAVIEYGPAAWTGRVAGLSPEAMTALGASTDDTLEYAFASPCQQTGGSKPGTGERKGRGITPKPTAGIPELIVQEDHRLQYKDRGTITPSMIVLHWTGGDSFSGALGGLENRMPEVGNLSVQIMIDKDGKAYQLMDSLNEKSAGAAGANDWAINIEIVGNGPSALINNAAEINTTTNVVRSLSNKFGIPHIISVDSTNPDSATKSALLNHRGVFSHQIVDKYLNDSPTGKTDPSDTFMKTIKNNSSW